jgi:hypothetical protein
MFMFFFKCGNVFLKQSLLAVQHEPMMQGHHLLEVSNVNHTAEHASQKAKGNTACVPMVTMLLGPVTEVII